MTAARHTRAAFWEQAAAIRDEWEATGTACGPADQATAEQAITEVYARLGRARPRFVWVRSPREAQPLVSHLPTLQDLYRWVKAPPARTPDPMAASAHASARGPSRSAAEPVGLVSRTTPPVASDLATTLSRLRGRMDQRITTPWFDPPPPKRPKGDQWPDLPPEQGLAYGIPFVDVMRRHVREALFALLAHGFYLPAKRQLGEPSPVCWYGQQEAHWIAYYDAWRRLGLAKYEPDVDAELDCWQAIAQSCGWFWLDEHLCVVSHRPDRPRTFADGWAVPALS
ncbi:hypothetical protein [Allorhizocola rhizosphaerae]|uniref:hypothetical protein n=1 Tax=Allorhizocola rhizosphaerae TaxID=1872709 RepID=UPI000E3E467E|nr:hypothetical protein [Allorhizocola rhizosphaerae]